MTLRDRLGGHNRLGNGIVIEFRITPLTGAEPDPESVMKSPLRFGGQSEQGQYQVFEQYDRKQESRPIARSHARNDVGKTCG